MSNSVTIGVIANPTSARDIRRVVANAGNLQISDRVNIVQRVLAAAASCGVTSVLMMPDNGGMRVLLDRTLRRDSAQGAHNSYPKLDYINMNVTSTVEDTFVATRLLVEESVSAIVVLGGDGTHRAVVRELLRCGSKIPIAGLSTGTNNAFPEMREPTIIGIAVGLFASGRLKSEHALSPHKLIEIAVSSEKEEQRDIAIVDAVITNDHYIGARAIWKTTSLLAAYLAFADPLCVGLSAIGGLIEPVGRQESEGLAIEMATDPKLAFMTLNAPIAPGMMQPVLISNWERMIANKPLMVSHKTGAIALDGEREMNFNIGQKVSATLRSNAFFTVNVERCMHIAACNGLLRSSTPITNANEVY